MAWFFYPRWQSRRPSAAQYIQTVLMLCIVIIFQVKIDAQDHFKIIL